MGLRHVKVGRDIPGANNKIIQEWSKPFIDEVNSEKSVVGIKHDRNRPPRKDKIKLKVKDGEIYCIQVFTTKGEIMSQRGKGMYEENRKAKPYYVPVAEKRVGELADAIAASVGDVIGYNLSNL